MELKKHQVEALDFLAKRDGAAIFYEMGLGKTLIMLEHLKRLNELPVLIVCPLSAVSVWQREATKFGYPFSFIELTGTYKERVTKLNAYADVYVINYEGLRILKEKLYAKTFKTIIFDESHRIKERGAQQTQIALTLCKRIKNRFILSGTPVAKSPEDVWTQSEIIAPGALGNFYAFRARYINFKNIVIRTNGGVREFKKAVSFKYLEPRREECKKEDHECEECKEYLRKKMAHFSLRRTKKECIDLPEKIYKVIPCPLTDAQLKHYHGLKHSLATMLNDKQIRLSSMAAVIRKLQQVCQGFIYDEDGKTTYFKSSKIAMLKDILEDIPNEKAIVFTWFQADIDLLEKEITGSGRRVIRFGGSAEERASAESDFQETEDPAIFLANIEVAKESITLTAASHVIYYGNSWNYASRSQSEDRAHRIGQKKSVIYYDLVVPGTIDETVYETLKRKGNMADAITGDTYRMAQLALGLEAA